MNYINAIPPQQVQTAILSTPTPVIIKPYDEVDAEVTAYTISKSDCGKTDGITASGVRLSRGMVAAPVQIAFGTRIQIDGINYIVQDRGGAIVVDDNGIYHVDLYLPTKKEALKYGRQRKKIRIFRRK